MKEPAIEEFNQLYPHYAAKPFEDACDVEEPAQDAFNRLTVTGCSGFAFPRCLAGDSMSFYSKAESPDPMRFNSDGMFLTEVDGRRCLFVCELKSTFDSCQIAHAKEQIVGTLLRLKAQMSILQSKPNWEYHGVIVSYEPTMEQLACLCKLTSRDAKFSSYLCVKKHKQISALLGCRYYKPLDFPNMFIHYVPVPERKRDIKVNLRDLLGERRCLTSRD